MLKHLVIFMLEQSFRNIKFINFEMIKINIKISWPVELLLAVKMNQYQASLVIVIGPVLRYLSMTFGMAVGVFIAIITQ